MKFYITRKILVGVIALRTAAGAARLHAPELHRDEADIQVHIR